MQYTQRKLHRSNRPTKRAWLPSWPLGAALHRVLERVARGLRLLLVVNELSRFELSLLAVFLLPLALGFFLVAFA